MKSLVLLSLIAAKLLAASAADEDRAVADIEKQGGFVVRDDILADKPVVEVDLDGPKCTDNQLAELKAFWVCWR